MPYRYALLKPLRAPGAEDWNAAILARPCLGIEVTEPELAARCVLGNIDPQHLGGIDTPRRDLAAAPQSGHRRSRHRTVSRARDAHDAAPDAARRDLRRLGGQRRHLYARRRGDWERLQRRSAAPVEIAASPLICG